MRKSLNLNLSITRENTRKPDIIKWIDLIMPSVHKMVKHTLQILQQILQDFENLFHHFLESRHIIGLTLPNPFDSRSSQNYFH